MKTGLTAARAVSAVSAVSAALALAGTAYPASASTAHTGSAGCDDSLDGLVPQWYDGAATRSGATIVTVTAGQNLAGIGATLKSDGGITGSVTAKASGTPLGGVCVRAVPQTAGRAASFTTTARGSYTLTGLIPGTYTVEFSSGCGATGYAAQWWDDQSSAGSATAISVKPSAVTTGIDAALAS